MHSLLLLAAINLFTPAEQSRLDALTARVNFRTKAQIAVVTIPNTNGLGTREFTTRQFNTMKLGSAERNDGILIALFPQQRATEIVIGSGLRKTLPQYVLDEAAHQPPTADGIAEAIKILGAHLAGFDRKQSPPVPVFGAIAALAAALAATCLLRIKAFKDRPQKLPINAFVPAERDFQHSRLEDFFRQSARPPGGYESVPDAWIWGAWLGLCLAAAALSALGVALTNPNLEPSLWLLIPILGLPCTFTFVFLGSSNTGDFDAIPTLTFSAIGGAFIGFVLSWLATRAFVSDVTLAALLVPAAVFAVNAAIGYQIARNFYGHTPNEFICEVCASHIRELTNDEIQKLHPAWHTKSTPVRYRGWRCVGKCPTAYLTYYATEADAVCPTCKTPTISRATKSCTVCNYTKPEKRPTQSVPYTPDTATSTYEPSPTTSSYDDQWQRNQQWDNAPSDPPPSGGSTDGDGASSTW